MTIATAEIKVDKPYKGLHFLRTHYLLFQQSAADIAKECGVCENTILGWLAKRGIPRRSISEARSIKKWSTPRGPANPMYGRRGPLSPTWKGGLTPWRQTIYARAEWKAFVRKLAKRDRVCRLCGGKPRDIHHIEPVADAPMLLMDPGNALRLCRSCHLKLKGKEKRWRERLYAIVRNCES